MITHGDLIKELFKKSSLPPTFVALRNFLSWRSSPERILSHSDIESFVRLLLSQKSWQEKRIEIAKCLEQAASLIGSAESSDVLNLKDWVLGCEIFEVSNSKNLLEVFKARQKFREESGVLKKLVYNSDSTQLFELRREINGELQAFLLLPQFVLQNGSLEPLIEDFSLSFDQELNFVSGKLFLSQNHLVSVEKTDDCFKIFRVSKDLLGEVHTATVSDISQDPAIFYFLTRFEASILAPQAFPTRVKTISFLTSTLNSLKKGNGISAERGDEWLKAQDLVEAVFHHDKELSLLLRECEFELKKVESPWQNNYKDSIKLLQTQVSAREELPTDSLKKAKSSSTGKRSSNSELEFI